MKHFALKEFLWNENGDGHTAVEVKIGDERDFGEAAEGLLAEGYIGESPAPADAPIEGDGDSTANPEPDAATIDIPDGWADLSGNKLKSLAAKLTTDPIRNKADAVAAIEAEFARRAAAAPAETPTAETPASTDAPPAGDGQGDAENPAQA